MWSSWLWCQSSYKITLSVFTVNFLRPQCMVGELPSWPSSDWNWEHMSQRVRDLAIEWQLSILASNNVQSSASRHQCSAAVANIVTYLFAFCVLCGTRLVSFCLWAPANESTVTRLVAYVSLCICCFNALTFKSLDTKRSFLICRYIFRIFTWSSYFKDIGSTSKPQEQKNVKCHPAFPRLHERHGTVWLLLQWRQVHSVIQASHSRRRLQTSFNLLR